MGNSGCKAKAKKAKAKAGAGDGGTEAFKEICETWPPGAAEPPPSPSKAQEGGGAALPSGIGTPTPLKTAQAFFITVNNNNDYNNVKNRKNNKSKASTLPPTITDEGRVHSATVSAVNPAARSVTVEWFEKGETKGKEIDFDAVFALNPDLAPQDQNVMPPPKLDDEDEESSLSEADLSDYVSGLNVGRVVRGSGRVLRSSRTHSNVPAAAHHPQRPPAAHTSHLPRPPGHQVARSQSASRLSMYTRQSQVSQPAAIPATRSKDASRPRPSYLVKPPPQNGEIRSNLQNKIGQSQARSTENISTSTVSKGSSVTACEWPASARKVVLHS